jgi:glycosyltransferase involved in cell wall biosynthesis
MKKKKILLLLPYPLRKAPSQRFRVEMFLPYLIQNNFEISIRPFIDAPTYSILYGKGRLFQKALGIAKGYLKRLYTVLFEAGSFDFVLIHREAAPLGPPVFEWLLYKVLRKKIIYDFDDAIWISDQNSSIINWMKSYWKVKYICKWSYKISSGNQYLQNFASQFNDQVFIIPTVVDTASKHNSLQDQVTQKITIGWTGSHSTLKYLEPVIPVLKKMTSMPSVEVLVICNQPPAFQFEGLRYVQWSEENEVRDLLQIHIGIMPLLPDKWSEGKCGFKIIQYLSMGIPAVASPVGVNSVIIEDGINGFLCNSPEEWEQSLMELIKDTEKRKIMGEAGRKKILEHYSLQATEDKFIDLFN